MEDPKAIVAAGYDALDASYRTWAAAVGDDLRDAWLDRLTNDLPAGARVLDLGCGPGVPTAQRLAERFDVTGVDISARQIAFARSSVPNARFVVADMTNLEFASASFEAIVAMFSLIHLPRRDLAAVLWRARDWLSPAGRLLATFGTVDDEGVQEDWLGVPMFFGTTSPDQSRKLLAQSGFEILAEEIIEIDEPGEGTTAFHWVDARALA